MRDLEDYLDGVGAILKANLNTEIDAITTEKDDDIDLPTITTEVGKGFFLQAPLVDITEGYFVMYGVSVPTPDSIGPESAGKHRGYAVIVAANPATDLHGYRRLFRYQRALIAVFEKRYDELRRLGAPAKIVALDPFPPELNNVPENAMAVGVSFEFTLVG